MNSERIARWLTIGANLGVLLGLLLLIAELAQNREMMRAQIRHELATGIVELLQAPANNDQLADVLFRGINGEPLTPTEMFQFELRTNALFRYWEDVHYQYRIGLYDDSEFSRQKAAWKSSMERSRLSVDYWCTVRQLYSPEFASEMDALLPTACDADQAIPELVIEELTPGVFLHKSFKKVDGYGLVSSNGLVVMDEKQAFLVDTPWSAKDTEKLASWIGDRGYELAGSLSTHSHDDRTAGIEWLNEHSVPTWTSAQTNEILESQEEATPTHSFEADEFSLDQGMVEAYYPGAGHTVDNLVVWLPKSRILFGGCFVRSLDSTGLGYTGEARIGEWADSVNKVIQKYPEAAIVVPGHGKSGDIELLYHTRQLAEAASARSAQADQ